MNTTDEKKSLSTNAYIEKIETDTTRPVTENNIQNTKPVRESVGLYSAHKPGVSLPQVVFLLVLFGALVALLYIFDFGKGTLISFNKQYLGVEKIVTSNVNTYSPSKTDAAATAEEPVSYQNSCPSDQIKLITDSSTLNGASVSCWPNTVSSNNKTYKVDTTIPIKSVFCPTGKSKVQSGDSRPPSMTVGCR